MESKWSRNVCAQCGGACCKSMPCAYAPDDFCAGSPENREDSLRNSIKRSVAENRAVIDASGGQLIVRAPGLLDEAQKVIHRSPQQGPSPKNTCIFLKEHGCLMPESERPLFGRLIMPHITSYVNNADGIPGAAGDVNACDGDASGIVCDYPREETLRAIQDWLNIQDLLIELVRELESKPQIGFGDKPHVQN